MTQHHPITPPPELVQQWLAEYFGYNSSDELTGSERFLATRAAQWAADQAEINIEHKLQKAADQELEACRHWLEVNGAPRKFIDGLLAFRRPKPPSLKEQALEALRYAPGRDDPNPITLLTADEHALIRRALEQLDD